MNELLNILPNLSIGVISVLALVYTMRMNLKALDARADKHEKAMNEREERLRVVEESVRVTLTEHITQASVALRENTKILERVANRLDAVS